ncbi:haloacid dehalogenase [Aliidongia dinghuensis]|uniref:(S)-2-haloacid dehalogenase n=1 Tax=Aliidongia dinghuensis TaxID=1867774 RepID=A0A8J2YVY9_9PROT|nr:haloacid dehalogenase type II [Aliidongia dinghuensis]GGF30062.1 haloacid dehalogenase [Aliidongia dinghuensis]
MTIRALVFDAYGTLYDVQSVRSLAIDLCGDKGELVTQLWRLKQLEYSWLRSLMGTYEDFWPVTRAALEFSLVSAGITPTAALCEPLMSKYLRLDLYAEAKEALDALGGYTLAILSNGNPRMLEALVESSGLAGRFADVISVDRARSFKPDPACYALVEPALGVAPDEVLFVSSNGFDVAGAKQFGFKVARIERTAGAPAPQNSDVGPAEFARLVRGQAERLGLEPDWRVARLTDLAPLLKAMVP